MNWNDLIDRKQSIFTRLGERKFGNLMRGNLILFDEQKMLTFQNEYGIVWERTT